MNRDIVFDISNLNSTCKEFDSLLIGFIENKKRIYWIIENERLIKSMILTNLLYSMITKFKYLEKAGARKDFIYYNSNDVFKKIFNNPKSYPYLYMKVVRIDSSLLIPEVM